MIEKLTKLGFAMNEAKVYVALTKLGSATTSDLTKESGVHRVNVYEIINKLKNKGLISSIKKNNKTVYTVGDPQNLLRFIQQKEEIAKEIIPQLKGLHEINKDEEEVFYFTGPEGLITAYYMILDEEETVMYAMGGSGLNRKALGYRHTRWEKDRKKKKMEIKGLYYESVREQKLKNLDPLWEVRFLPDSFQSPAMIDICGNLVLIILSVDKVKAIVIKNKAIADAYRKYFEFMWQFANP